MGGRGGILQSVPARAGLSLLVILALAGCQSRTERVLFDGQYYPTRERAVSRDDRQAFQVTVRRADRGIAGAREAGRHGGTNYCIKNFGTSEIEWAVGPDAPDESLQISGGSLTLSGRCITW